MKSLKRLLEEKPAPLTTVTPGDTVLLALERMAQFDIGAVLVMEGEELVGILSERDYARKVILHGKTAQESRVKEIMSDKVLCVSLARTLEECMALMTEHRVRHLPVLGPDFKVVGILSIGDLVKETIADQAFIIQQLEHYIMG